MTKWKTIRIRQEIMTAVERTLETGEYRSLSEFVSEAIKIRLNELHPPRTSATRTVEKPIKYPVFQERLLSSSNHIWTMVTPEGNIRVGLTDFAQGHLKGVLKIQTEPVGCEVSKEKPFGSVETWMFRFDLYTPVSGKIVKLNKAVKDSPSMINEDPYEAGWIAEIKSHNIVTLEEELRDLMSPIQYKMWAIKLRHFPRAKP